MVSAVVGMHSKSSSVRAQHRRYSAVVCVSAVVVVGDSFSFACMAQSPPVIDRALGFVWRGRAAEQAHDRSLTALACLLALSV